MTVLISALAFLVLLSFLVLIHECGHYFAARAAGVTVEEFGFGLPPRARALFRRNGTIFSLNWIPFGGFVRLRGENASTERERRTPGNFAYAGIPARVVILTAGVFMNFLFAVIVFAFGFSVGQWVPSYLSVDDLRSAAQRGEIFLEEGVQITAVQPEGSAAEAGVLATSLLLAVDGAPVFVPEDVVAAQQDKESVVYTVQEVAPQGGEAPAPRAITVPVREGKTGIEIAFAPRVTSPRRSLGQASFLALREAKVATAQTVIGVAQLFRSLARQGEVPEGITGIVGIARLTHDSVQQGWASYLRLMAVLSLSLAVLNILPFPALDGGRLAFVLIEGIVRRPPPRRFELITNTVGFLVLIGLIILVTFNDIWQLF